MEKAQRYLTSFITPTPTSKQHGFINLSDPNLYIAAVSILFNPIFWNIVARAEYRTHILTRTVGFGSPRNGCYVLALTIFLLGILRDHLYKTALDSQPLTTLPFSDFELGGVPGLTLPALAGLILFTAGQTLVLSSMWALGLTGTYLGDYFGILMDHKVEGFPFNLSIALGAPMYVGSTLCFLGTALFMSSGAGLVLTGLVAVAYAVATIWFEDPFTSMIYANKDSSSSSSSSSSATKESKKNA